MAFISGSIADGQVANSVGALYTVPALTVAYLKAITLFNDNAADQTIIVYLHRSGSTRRKWRRFVLAQNESAEVIDPGASIQLSAGDSVDAVTTTVTAVDFTITGVRQS